MKGFMIFTAHNMANETKIRNTRTLGAYSVLVGELETKNTWETYTYLYNIKVDLIKHGVRMWTKT